MNWDELDFENPNENVENSDLNNSQDNNQEANQQQTSNSGNNNPPSNNNNDGNEEEQDVLTSYLKHIGINDLDHIKFEDEDEIVKDKSWNDLTFEEKMNILITSKDEPERDLTNDEIGFINEIRRSKLSPSQYINTIQQKAQQDYAETLQATPQYSIDGLSDDEIFKLDLQDKIEDISEEEIEAALNKAKEDPLYARRIAGMRKTLKDQEEQYKKQLVAEQEQARADQFNQFKDAVLTSIQSLNKVGDVDLNLENDDMEDIASFILDTDDSGMSYFGKALNDPRTLVEMAWWTLKGRDALNSISEYFVNEIKNQKQISYQKGLEDGKKSSTKVVYKPSNETKLNARSIDDIYG